MLGKVDQVNGYVGMTLDKLPAIRGDLVRTDPTWESWNFEKLTEALRLWTRRNPIQNQSAEKSTRQQDDSYRKHDKPSRVYHTPQKNQPHMSSCVYCESTDHKSTNCPKVVNIADRKKILLQKRLCYNCSGTSHRAADCRSKITCQICTKKHHTSICETEQKPEDMLTARKTDQTEVVYPVVLLGVDGIKTCALLDPGAGSSYPSAKLINALRKKPTEVKTKRI